MRKLDIALGVIEQNSQYFFQFRNGDPKIGAAGMLGFFGGKIEPKEKPIDAIVRELSEETNLQPSRDDVKPLGKVNVLSDYLHKPVAINAHVFHLIVTPQYVIEAFEGEIVKMNHKEAMQNLAKMTPGTRACFEQKLV